MAHFYGEISGTAITTGTRCGSKSSGMRSHTRSWGKGVEVDCRFNENMNKNVFRVYITGGSNNPSNRQLLSEFEEDLG